MIIQLWNEIRSSNTVFLSVSMECMSKMGEQAVLVDLNQILGCGMENSPKLSLIIACSRQFSFRECEKMTTFH